MTDSDQRQLMNLARLAGATIGEDGGIAFPDPLALQYFAVLVVGDPSSEKHVRLVARRLAGMEGQS